MKGGMPRTFVALFAGMLFGLGLAISGMMNPAKVIGFLDVAGGWDPTLAFVMGGALLVTIPAFRLVLGANARSWRTASRCPPGVTWMGGCSEELRCSASAGGCPGSAQARRSRRWLRGSRP
jgi:uncharacterized membrane protein YedE/YeeE